MPRLLPAVATVLMTVALTACGGEDKAANADPAATVALPAFAQPKGTWHGMASCAGRDFPLRLAFNGADDAPSTATLIFEPALNSAGYASPRGYAPETVMVTERFPQAGTLELRAGDGGRPAAAVSLLLTPRADATIAALNGCEFAVLAPAASGHPVLGLREELDTLRERPVLTEADMTGACPAQLESWIAKGLALPLDAWGRGDSSTLWSDETAREVFGRPFSEIGAAERNSYFLALMGRCGERGNRRRSGIITQLARLTDYRSFRDARLRDMTVEVIQRWRGGLDDLLAANAAGAPVPLADARAVRSIPRRFAFDEALGAARNAEGLDGETQQLLQSALASQHNLDVLANLDAAAGSFIRLTAHYERARVDPQVDAAAATRRFAALLPNAAADFAASATSPAAARSMAGWLADWPQREACTATLKAACRATQREFERRLDALAEAWAATEAATLQTLAGSDASLALLASGIEWYAEIDARYGAVLEREALAALREEASAWLASLQTELESPLLAEIRAAGGTPALRAIEARYLAPGDLQRGELRRVREALEERIAAARPFHDTGADDYLNALYNRDFAALRQLDAAYLAGVRTAFGFIAQQVAMFDELAAAGTGARPFAAVVSELRSPSALRAAAVAYLTNYENVYGGCLDSTAVEFTFTERTDVVTRDGSGFELSRIEGVTSSTHYRVKRSLAGLFRDSFSRPPEAGGERIYRMLFEDDGIRRVTDAVRHIMRNYDCEATEVRQLEAGMVAYQAELHRRWGVR